MGWKIFLFGPTWPIPEADFSEIGLESVKPGLSFLYLSQRREWFKNSGHRKAQEDCSVLLREVRFVL